MSKITREYKRAKEKFAEVGVDTEKVIRKMKETEISVNCWQGDDIKGFEVSDAALSGGILVTGNYPGCARNPEELRQDIEKAFSLLPGQQRLNLHANYLETEGKAVDRDAVEPEHFENWMEWGREQGVSLDFNTTMFSHPKAADGYTLGHYDKGIRDFWIEHGQRVRTIGEEMGKRQKNPCVINHWMVDGSKDTNTDKFARRKLFVESMDQILAKDISKEHVLDSIESKLFGIGLESFTAGSGEMCLAYALTRDIMVTYDLGHFHPTESVGEKISSVFQFVDKILLHTSRPVRWDSDHVVTLQDPVQELMQELVRADALNRAYIALDFFDASINRVAAWIIGTRATQQALMRALLEPVEMLHEMERKDEKTWRLALLEDQKNMPFGAVWNYYCEQENVPGGRDWMDEIKQYEKDVLFARE